MYTVQIHYSSLQHSFLILIIMLLMYIPFKDKLTANRSLKEDEIKRYGQNEYVFNDDEIGDIVQ